MQYLCKRQRGLRSSHLASPRIPRRRAFGFFQREPTRASSLLTTRAGLIMSTSQSVVSTNVSSLYNTSRIRNVPIPTQQRDIGIADPAIGADLLPEHASFASYNNLGDHPPLLVRLTNNNYTVQIFAFSGNAQPIAFTFQSPILPDPFVIQDLSRELHVIVCTGSGSVYRLVLPPPGYWEDAIGASSNDWQQEHVISSTSRENLSSFYVSDTDTAFVGLRDGSILKLQARRLRRPEPFKQFDRWTEATLSVSHGITLPFFGSQVIGSSDIISISSASSELVPEVAFSLSRDRQLRIWKDRCIGSIQVPATYDDALHRRTAKATSLLSSNPGTYIRVLPQADGLSSDDPDANCRVVVFIPTLVGNSGGFFTVYRLSPKTPNGSRYLESTDAIPSSPATIGYSLRDFIVVDETIWCLWQHYGVPYIEFASLLPKLEGETVSWQPVVLLSTPDYTPAYFDEVLSQNESLNDCFMNALLRPGAFSRYTLEVALHQYREALESIPDLENPILAQTFASVEEHIAGIVGCTVELATDLQSGEQLWDQYWSALKRDWEGFVARCKEIERSARWPLALGVGLDGQPVLLERERVGVVVLDDVPLRAYKWLSTPAASRSPAPSASWDVLGVAQALYDNIPLEDRQALDSELAESWKASNPESLLQVSTDIAERVLWPSLADAVSNWVVDRLEAFENVAQNLLDAMAVITDIEADVKGELLEEDEEGNLLMQERGSAAPAQYPTNGSMWHTELVAAYTASSVSARHRLAISLVALTLFVVHALPDTVKTDHTFDTSPTFVTAALRLYQNTLILEKIAIHPPGRVEALPSPRTPGDPDDLLAKLRGMRVTSVGPPSGAAQPHPSSITVSLLSLSGVTSSVSGSAHHFFRVNGLLLPPAENAPYAAEASVIDQLRRLGQLGLALDFSGWLPLASALAYATARTYLEIGRIDEAVLLFDQVGNSFGVSETVQHGDFNSLLQLLPVDARSSSTYYRHVAELFYGLSLVQFVIHFSKLAIESSEEDDGVQDLWDALFKGQVSLGLYEEAYMTLLEAPNGELQSDFIRHLVAVMCDRAEIQRLLELNFVGLQSEVEQTLAFKARNSDPLSWPNYSQALYAWHIFRGDYRNAGQAMFYHARRLKEIIPEPHEASDLNKEQARCLLAAINCLALVDPKSAWVAVPRTAAPKASGLDAWGLNGSNVEEDPIGGSSSVEMDLLELKDIRMEYIMVMSPLLLSSRYGTTYNPALMTSKADIVSRYVVQGAFDDAISAARSLEVPMHSLFENLALRCVRLSGADPDLTDELALWLLRGPTRSWGGTVTQRAWRYLKQCLEKNDLAGNDYEYRQIVLKKILDEDRTARLPLWLVQFFEEHQPEYLIRMCFKYDLIEDALRHSVNVVRDVQRRSRGFTKASREPFRTSSATWLPYNVFDQLLGISADSKDQQVRDLGKELKQEIGTWLTMAKKFTTEIRSGA